MAEQVGSKTAKTVHSKVKMTGTGYSLKLLAMDGTVIDSWESRTISSIMSSGMDTGVGGLEYGGKEGVVEDWVNTIVPWMSKRRPLGRWTHRLSNGRRTRSTTSAAIKESRDLDIWIFKPSKNFNKEGKGGYYNNHIIYKKFFPRRTEQWSSYHHQDNKNTQLGITEIIKHCSVFEDEEEDNQRYYGVSAKQETNQNSQVIPGI
ncbi:hypothetical protein PPACK8108_LOCUS630 [Phakopsora pachyrhizi]|uniref:Uncharacterized protein n=1 Tax=Phakopsora pachyrhizi TaxID=170000 RepID=A0AAV0AEF2_PHAPC|nr:hypothetical protein PPACK8108_LOCUS630 [Phakopsora pachyrhizi]